MDDREELLARIQGLEEMQSYLCQSLRNLVRYAEAVRYSAGMGKNQLERLELAKIVLAKARG